MGWQDLAKDLQEANWFSAPSALRVYGQYLNLDKDHNGMLSKAELLAYGTGTLTPAFVDRVFQVWPHAIFRNNHLQPIFISTLSAILDVMLR